MRGIFMGGSGGGASGAVSYPAYMTVFHQQILDHTGSDHPNNSFIEAFNLAYGNSPFVGAVAFNPDLLIESLNIGVARLSTFIVGLDQAVDFNNAISTARGQFLLGTTIGNTATLYPTALDTTVIPPVVVSGGEIANDIAAMDVIFTDQIEQEELPRFRAGMLNINAIHSSAYIIGEALIRASKDKALIKYGTDLQLKTNEQVRDINSRLTITQAEINARHAMSYREITARLQQSYSEIDARFKLATQEVNAKFYTHREELIHQATTGIIAELMKKGDLTYQHAHVNSEVQRLAILAKKEQSEEQLAIDESDAKWDIELFRYAGIILAAPSGGVAQGNEKKSRITSAIGGAISGAAAGTAIGGPGYGTAIGAIAGIGLSFLQ
jgi:transposase